MNRVHLNRLKLTNFRNYEAATIEPGDRHVVLTGENGAGKTNIMEAVSFLSPGRGMRRAKYDQVARSVGDGTWSVFANLEGGQGEVSIGTGIQMTVGGADTQRKVHIDGEQAKTSDELLMHSRILWLTPSMDGLFTGAAGDRRKFVDRLVLAIDPSHGRRVSDYEKVMRSRNRLLGEDFSDPTWLEATETQLAELGVAIAAARQELVLLLSSVIVKNANPSSPFPDALVNMSGSIENEIQEMSAGDLETEYAQRLRSNRSIDARAGRTLEGVHRSDLIVQHRPKSMPAKLCSTGEQKALLIGLLLAHAQLVGEMATFSPILLLDEVAAHLDEGRRAALYDIIDEIGCQAWMTGTDRSLFDALDGRAKFLLVEEGKVLE